MTEYSESVVMEAFSSAFVDEVLFAERVGGSKADPAAILRYLSLPLAERPEVSLFFDPAFYRRRYPDVAAAEIDPLVHFMQWGVSELRMPHPLIDIQHILATNPDLLPAPPTIDALYDVLTRDLADPGPVFSLTFYRRQLDDADQAPGGLLRHFLSVGLLRGLKPSPGFDPIACFRRAEYKTHDIRSGLSEFVLSSGALRDALDDPPSEGQANALFRVKAEADQLFRKRNPIRFNLDGTPGVSVIMVVRDNFFRTLKTLASLRANQAGPIELILIDSGSTDETRQLDQYVTGACRLRFETDIGFVRGSNAGLEIASADTVLFLGNDLELADGAIEVARRRLLSSPRIGAVGGKMIRSDGTLREAGRTIWRDGWSSGYQENQSPLVPEANFVRDVDYCSADFLIAHRSVLRDVNGFDLALANGGFHDADLCVRIRDAGYRTVYDPMAVIYHQSDRTPGYAAPAREAFVKKHRDKLRPADDADSRTRLSTRSVGQARRRVLFIENRLPLRRLGSGYVRSNDIISVMAELGYQVSVYPIHCNDQNLAAVYGDFPDTVEVFHDRGQAGLDSFLAARRDYYNTIWIARNHNLDILRPILERCGVDVPGGVRVVLDTEAIVANREAQIHAASDRFGPFPLDQAMRAELLNAPYTQTVLAVTAHEAAQLRALGLPDVRVLGHVRPLALTTREWNQRAGLLFVGAMHGTDSPNFDSMCWFVDNVLPLIERELGYETRLTIAGFTSGGADLSRFADHPRITLRGEVADLTPLYNANRVFVAPTRFAAGLPYKVHEAASLGLPVVATEVLRRQLGWQNGQTLLAADVTEPGAFAAHVVALYRDQALWNDIRAAAAEQVRIECGRGAFGRIVAGVLG